MNAHARHPQSQQSRCWFRHRFRWAIRRTDHQRHGRLSTCRTLRRHAAKWHRATAVALAILAVMLGVAPGQRHMSVAEAAIAGWCPTTLRPADTWNTLTVDINVNRRRVTSTGEAVGAPAPATLYQLERSSRTGTWKTVLTVLSVARTPMYSFAGTVISPRSFPVARLEDDENGSPVRAYDANGVLVSPTRLGSTTSATTTARTTAQQWLDAFVAAPAKKTARQQAFEKAYGKATKVGTLNKYVRVNADRTDEVLVDPKVVIPVEANTIRGGQRVVHRTFVYGPAPDSSLVRTNVHADTVTNPSTGDRTIVDTAFSNVCLELRR